MRLVDSELFVSATDLSNFLSCRHRTALELGEAHGVRKRPRFDDPFLEIRSIAVPALGCGNGGLTWRDVEPRIVEAFEALPDVRVLLFAPRDAREEQVRAVASGQGSLRLPRS